MSEKINHTSYIQISKENLLNNIGQCRKLISENTKVAAVVKANAYGHGVKEVVSVIEDVVEYFQVDDLLELREIREYTDKPVLVLGYVQSDQLEEFLELDAELGVCNLETIERLGEIGKSVKVHVKIDALLGRQGVLLEETKEFFEEIQKYENIEVVAIYSHFSNIEDTSDLNHAKKQFDILMEAKGIAEEVGFVGIKHHISATSGILTDVTGKWGGDIVRFGIGLYGLWPSNDLKERYSNEIELKPVMRWVSQLAQVKEVPEGFTIGYGCTYTTNRLTKIAVVPQGYSDGYDRGLSNEGEVLVGGKRCSVLGRVAMNMFVIDVTEVDGVGVGDEVVLLGDEITAEELSEKVGTINYEIVTRVWPKLPRVVV